MAPRDLYIVRHGIAETENPEHPGSDHWRRLTDAGRQRLELAARGMRRLGNVPAVIWTSPHVRAQETAAVLSAVLEPAGGVVEVDALGFDGSVAQVLAMVSEATVESLMLVGHNPRLSDLASEVVSGGRLRLRLKKGSLFHARLLPLPRGPSGELVGYMSPRALAACAD